MLMSVVEDLRYGAIYPELADRRVLITGLSSDFGVDIAREFAEHRCRMILQAKQMAPEVDEIANIIAQSAGDVELYGDVLASADKAVQFAQGPAQKAFGGLDVVINLIKLEDEDLSGLSDLTDVEDLVSDKLLAPMLMARVAANRMRLTWTEGLILNIVSAPDCQNGRQAAAAALVGGTLAAMTRKEAQDWADQAVRINAIGPGAVLPLDRRDMARPNEPDLAALALYLASSKGRRLSGHVFDAAGLAGRIN